MTPSQLSAQLRHIAAKISNSKSPQRNLVAEDLKRILIALDESPVDFFSEWEKVGVDLYNKEYEKHGPNKHEIEDMKTDLEYEIRVVECIAEAWDNWKSIDHPAFEDLPFNDQVKATSMILESLDAKYGSYRGNLPDIKYVKRALRHI